MDSSYLFKGELRQVQDGKTTFATLASAEFREVRIQCKLPAPSSTGGAGQSKFPLNFPPGSDPQKKHCYRAKVVKQLTRVLGEHPNASAGPGFTQCCTGRTGDTKPIHLNLQSNLGFWILTMFLLQPLTQPVVGLWMTGLGPGKGQTCSGELPSTSADSELTRRRKGGAGTTTPARSRPNPGFLILAILPATSPTPLAAGLWMEGLGWSMVETFFFGR